MCILPLKFIIFFITIQLLQHLAISLSEAQGLSNNSTPNILSNNDKVIVAYYPNWRREFLAENNLPWSKITHVNYAFAIVNDNFIPTLSDQNELVLTAISGYAHAFNVKILIAIGGWSGSQQFSTLVSSVESRGTFINATMTMVNKFKLDGVNIDWEYPGRKGMECNALDKNNDTNNFLILLQELRIRLGNDKLLTVAGRAEPFDGPNGPLTDVSGFAKILDWVNVMAYDLNVDEKSLTGPNAPFDIDNKRTPRPFSFKQSIQSWKQAGLPSSKIVIGVEFFGRARTASRKMFYDNQYVPCDSKIPQGDQYDELQAEPCPGSPQLYSGMWSWWSLRNQELLPCTISGSSEESSWIRNFDNTTQTPWLYNSDTNIYISYDDPQSLYVKVDYTKQQDLLGIMIWEITADNGQELLNVVYQLKENDLTLPTNDCDTADGTGTGKGKSEKRIKLALSGVTIAGITLGCATFLSALTFIFYCFKNKKADASAAEPINDTIETKSIDEDIET